MEVEPKQNNLFLNRDRIVATRSSQLDETGSSGSKSVHRRTQYGNVYCHRTAWTSLGFSGMNPE